MFVARTGAIVVLLALAGCSRAPLEVGPSAESLSGEKLREPAPEVSPPEPAPVEEPAAPAACEAFGDLGDSAEEAFERAEWQIQANDCDSSACWDFLRLDAACGLWYQHANEARAGTAAAGPCRAAKRILTSRLFNDALAACPAGKNAVNEAFDVSGAVAVRRKLEACDSQVLAGVRACLRAVIAATLP